MESNEVLVDAWRRVFDILYRGTPEQNSADDKPDFRGWMDSSTNKPIPVNEMKEWLDAVMRRVLALRPFSILDIGSGTGNLVMRLAPVVHFILATDVSPVALQSLRRRIARARLTNVELLATDALSLRTRLGASFDTIVVNSVCQYFPSTDYASDVLHWTCSSVGERGAVFIGDVTNAALEERQAKWRRRGNPRLQNPSRVSRDNDRKGGELAYFPTFFTKLRMRTSRLVAVPLLKTTRASNEMSLFRYDVVIAPAAAQALRSAETRWSEIDASALRDMLLDGVDVVFLREVPNSRFSKPTHATLPHPWWWNTFASKIGFRAYPLWLNDTVDGSYTVAFFPDHGPHNEFDPRGYVRSALLTLED